MERSPKRQRLNDPYSPASPLPTADTKASFVSPQTPPPSVRMSPTWTAPSNSNQQQPTSGSHFPTPPSTAGYQGHMAGRGASSDAGGESGRQTPMTEDGSEMRKDGDGDAEMADRQGRVAKVVTMVDAEHRRTDHERQEKGALDSGMPSTPGAQRIYKLSTSRVEPVKPHPSQNFIELYGLQKIQQSVARRDPVTGEKINKLRKSYENKVKNLKLDGRNKAQSNQGELGGLLHPGWDERTPEGDTLWVHTWTKEDANQGKRLDLSEDRENLFSKLGAAFDMLPGKLPPKEHREWDNMLGLDDQTVAAGNRTPAGAAANPQPAAASPANTARGNPDRPGKRRRYHEGTYVGYGDDDEDNGSAKRQKQQRAFSSSRNSPSIATGASSSGNMIGVTSS
ncbi:Mediator of RNA polymerase II transcription subunit 19 [Lecanosticta acicola]|uniref:Mediator of RNA polymerase II transcription subunit 19 n=1 Tax=Lecanosticta acicola TaxID=111012 RepID=A0AAI9EAE6_9PEZI|nr:Mediator of RNA polymerase II transcription subunit 19 [Lecanosticta acicola]